MGLVPRLRGTAKKFFQVVLLNAFEPVPSESSTKIVEQVTEIGLSHRELRKNILYWFYHSVQGNKINWVNSEKKAVHARIQTSFEYFTANPRKKALCK